MPEPSAVTLTPLEVAVGIPVDTREVPVHLPTVRAHPAEALLTAMVPWLEAGPCFVAFSGGRDSSLVLAAGVRAAREHGLAPPVPVTLRYPNAPDTAEAAWQELVLAHLGLRDPIVITVRDEHAYLGEVNQRVLGSHGLLWPPNIHNLDPVAAVAANATLLTGLHGDDLFGGWRFRSLSQVARRTRRARPKDVARLAHAVLPPATRARLLRRRLDVPGWLRAPARQRAAERLATLYAAEPRSWPTRVAWWAGLGYHRHLLGALSAVASSHGCQVRDPFLDPRFLGALANHGGRRGYGDRTDVMTALFGELLPDQVLQRRTKAKFSAVFWNAQARSFAQTWGGDGLPAELVDVDRLQQTWLAAEPDGRSALCLQAAWLASA